MKYTYNSQIWFHMKKRYQSDFTEKLNQLIRFAEQSDSEVQHHSFVNYKYHNSTWREELGGECGFSFFANNERINIHFHWKYHEYRKEFVYVDEDGIEEVGHEDHPVRKLVAIEFRYIKDFPWNVEKKMFPPDEYEACFHKAKLCMQANWLSRVSIRSWKSLNKVLRVFLISSEIHYLFREPRENERVYVLYAKSQICGYAWIETNDDGTAYLHEFEIRSKNRSVGYGRLLLNHILMIHPKIILHAIKDSVSYWRKFNFKKWGRLEDGLTPMKNFK